MNDACASGGCASALQRPMKNSTEPWRWHPLQLDCGHCLEPDGPLIGESLKKILYKIWRPWRAQKSKSPAQALLQIAIASKMVYLDGSASFTGRQTPEKT